ncbi:MAG TPA: hypothetical protein VLS48_03695 [Anaerolineales bacterium]|nr:hypothetical protein [Anaerolineales bacterium]
MDIPSTALILVAVMTNPRDLEIARLLGWYRIPLRSAPKVVAVDYLAFYQTAAFGEAERWQIRYLAPVQGHELTTRAALMRSEPDHPHADQAYYKIQLGPLQELPQPVLAGRWRRITFFYTTGEYLLRANTINDLVVETEERPILWRALRERIEGEEAEGLADLPTLDIDLDPALVAALLGIRELDGQYGAHT